MGCGSIGFVGVAGPTGFPGPSNIYNRYDRYIKIKKILEKFNIILEDEYIYYDNQVYLAGKSIGCSGVSGPIGCSGISKYEIRYNKIKKILEK